MRTKINLKMSAGSIGFISAVALFMFFVYSCGNTNSTNSPDEKSTGKDSANSSTVSKENAESTEAVSEEKAESTETKSDAKTAALTFKETLAKAKKEGNTVFLVVTDSNKTDIMKALEIAGKANLSVKKSVVATMDREDKNNKEYVTKFGVAGASLPLLLIISPKGVVAGGYLLKDATADLLVKAVPSPKQDEVLLALNDKKSVFVVAAKSTFTDKAKAVENCKAAVSQMAGKAELVQVDLGDTKEKAFLELMKIDLATTATATVVLNTRGQVNGVFYEAKDAASLVTLAKKLGGGCCPGGSSKGCGK